MKTLFVNAKKKMKMKMKMKMKRPPLIISPYLYSLPFFTTPLHSPPPPTPSRVHPSSLVRSSTRPPISFRTTGLASQPVTVVLSLLIFAPPSLLFKPPPPSPEGWPPQCHLPSTPPPLPNRFISVRNPSEDWHKRTVTSTQNVPPPLSSSPRRLRSPPPDPLLSSFSSPHPLSSLCEARQGRERERGGGDVRAAT